MYGSKPSLHLPSDITFSARPVTSPSSVTFLSVSVLDNSIWLVAFNFIFFAVFIIISSSAFKLSFFGLVIVTPVLSAKFTLNGSELPPLMLIASGSIANSLPYPDPKKRF